MNISPMLADQLELFGLEYTVLKKIISSEGTTEELLFMWSKV